MLHERDFARKQILTILISFIAFCQCIDTNTVRKCAKPVPPKNAKITGIHAFRRYQDRSYPAAYGVEEYQEYDEVTFTCKEGYIRTGILPYFNKMYTTCGSNGKWFPDTSLLGHCVPTKSISNDKCNVTQDIFKCKKSGKCISKEKLCDCTLDCADGSDEIDCQVRRKFIFATPTLHSNGIISSPGYPRPFDYAKKPFNCIYHIYTLIDHYVQIDFEDFDLPRKQKNRCVDNVRINPIHPQFLRRRKPLLRKKYHIRKIRNSQTKCGKNMFKRIYSNSSHITINVSLGHTSKPLQHKGFSLNWQVRDKVTFYTALRKELGKRKKDVANSNKKEVDDEESKTLYNIVLPIALGGFLLTIVLLLFLFQRILRHHCQVNGGESTPEKKEALTMTLTENNLAKFDEQNNSISTHIYDDLRAGLLKTTSFNNVETHPDLCNKQDHSTHRHSSCRYSNCTKNSQKNVELNSSHNMLTCDTQNRSSPSGHTTHSSNNSYFSSSNSKPQQSRSGSVRSTSCSRNSSPCFNSQQQQRYSHRHTQRHSQRYSRENVQHSSSSSQATTCSLCHKRKSDCYSERNNRSHLPQSLSHPLVIETESTYPVMYDFTQSPQSASYTPNSQTHHTMYPNSQNQRTTYSPNSQNQQHSLYTQNSVDYSQNNVSNQNSPVSANRHKYRENELYGSNEEYPFKPPRSRESVEYSNYKNSEHYPLDYIESDYIVDSAFMDAEKNSDNFYYDNMPTDNNYNFYDHGIGRGGSLVISH